MRIVVRTSKLAIWARRLALFSAALLVISTLLHVFGHIASDVFETILVIGIAGAAAAFLSGLAAYIRLWFTGDKGWGPATLGFVLGLLGLAPAGVAAALVELYPSTVDVTTAFADPPRLRVAHPESPEIDPETVLASFPNLITRIYQLPPDLLFRLAGDMVRANGWTLVSAEAPSGPEDSGELNAIRRSLLGWEHEIAFRITPNPIGALIDLRAASLRPTRHDLGENGRAIEAFLLALDDRVSAWMQANPALDEEDQNFVVLGDDLAGDEQPDAP